MFLAACLGSVKMLVSEECFITASECRTLISAIFADGHGVGVTGFFFFFGGGVWLV